MYRSPNPQGAEIRARGARSSPGPSECAHPRGQSRPLHPFPNPRRCKGCRCQSRTGGGRAVGRRFPASAAVSLADVWRRMTRVRQPQRNMCARSCGAVVPSANPEAQQERRQSAPYGPCRPKSGSKLPEVGRIPSRSRRARRQSPILRAEPRGRVVTVWERCPAFSHPTVNA